MPTLDPALDLESLAPPAMVRRAGFYPDPSHAADERYWDGRSWTERTRGHKPGGLSTLAVVGLVLALLFPVGGVVVAVMLLMRHEVGPGLGVLLACGVGAVIFVALAGG